MPAPGEALGRPHRVHVPAVSAAATPTRPLDTDDTRLLDLRPYKLRATVNAALDRQAIIIDLDPIMTVEFILHQLKPTEAICAIVEYDLPARRMLSLLGIGSFVDRNIRLQFTAKHVIRSANLENRHVRGCPDRQKRESASFAPAVVVGESTSFDIAALKADLIIPPSPYLTVVDLPINNNDDYVTVEYAESLFQLGQDAKSDEIMFTPATRKGNITKAYVSTFPESTPTRSIEFSFPVLRGRAGHP